MEFQVFVNEKKNTVTVKATDPIEEYLIEFSRFYTKFNMYPDVGLFDDFVEKYGRQIKKMVGVATCNIEQGDTFDPDFGKKLAYERYLKVFETHRINMYNMIRKKLEDMHTQAYIRFSYCVNRRINREDIIDDKIESLRING